MTRANIDTLICPPETRRGIAAFVTRRQLDSDEYPAPVDFLLKRMGEVRIVRPEDGSRDFLLQRQDALEAGAALVGPLACEIIHPAPAHILRMSFDYLFGHIAERFNDPVLMFCRIAYAFANHRLCSKKQAGEWALDEFGADWSEIVRAALETYEGRETARAVTGEKVRAFEKYCARYIAARG